MANCVNIPEFIEPDCGFETGRIVAIAFINKRIHSTIYANPSNNALWVDGSYAADLFIFKSVRGTYDGGSPIEVAGVGDQDSRVINADRNMEVSIQGVKSNESFFDELVKSPDYMVAYVVGGDYQTLFINNKRISVFGGAPVEEGLDSEMVWKVKIKWKDIKNPKSSNVPAVFTT